MIAGNERNVMRRLLYFLLYCVCLRGACAIEVSFIALEEKLDNAYYIDAKGAYNEIELNPYQPEGAVFLPPIEGMIRLFSKNVTNGVTKYEILVEAKVGSLDQALALFFTQSGSAKLVLFDNSSDYFTSGSLRIINMLPVGIVSKVSDKIIRTDTISVDIVTSIKLGKRPVVGVVSAYRRNQEWVHFFNKPVAVLPDTRVTVISAATASGMDLALGIDESELSEDLKVDFFIHREKL